MSTGCTQQLIVILCMFRLARHLWLRDVVCSLPGVREGGLARRRIDAFRAGDLGENGMAELWEAIVRHDPICQA